MQNNKLLALLLIVPVLFFGTATAYAGNADQVYTAAQVQSLCDGIIAYNGASSAQDFIDGALCQSAGTTAEFYAIALSQSGDYDFSGYESALLDYLDTHEIYSAASREKYALALAAAGSTDRYISDTADEAIGGLGVMSLVFGLHLLNNGYDSALYSNDGLISELLSFQKDDGGWAVMGSYGDADVTAMTLQALAPYYGGRGDITSAVDRALERLSQMQLDSGGFKTMGAENCESAAQVIIALSALGIDAQTDERFIKNGSSVMNAMMSYAVGDGSFAHTDTSNFSATLEVFCALTAYKRFCFGQGSLYQLDHAVHGGSPENPNAGEPQGNNGGSGYHNNSRTDNGNTAGHSGGDTNSNDGGSSRGGMSNDTSQGGRVIVINGQRFVESTDAKGEPVTVSVSETQTTQATIVRPTYGAFQPNATADQDKKATADEAGADGGYKGRAILGVTLAACIACAVLYALKKRNKKHYIAVAIIAAAAILFILLTNFRSAESDQRSAQPDGAMTVTLAIRCDTIKGREKVNRFIPDDGVILETKSYPADEGDTVYDVLVRAAEEQDILLDNRGAPGAAYIAGINSLYEFDYGALSGWMYRVNGEFPDVGCQSCYVSDGDRIEWLYTMNIGRDLY